jgi:glycosyltransferase involved in cell wall biosynthesis
MSARSEVPAVSVIVAARNAERTLSRTLECLKNQEATDRFEVVVVDDGSSDQTIEIAQRFGPPVRTVRNSGKRGPGESRNVGVGAARSKLIAFTDADCFPAADWLQRGLDALECADLVQGAVTPDPGAIRAPFDRTVKVQHDDGYYRTANLFVRRELFDDIGGFEDWIVERGGDPPFGWLAPADGRPTEPARKSIGEDVLFGWKARRRGARIAFAPRARVHHAVFPGSPWRSARDRWHWRHIPALASRVPELREQTFVARYFFNRRSAEFDLALMGALAAGATQRVFPLVATLPYARRLYHEVGRWGPRRGVQVILGSLAEDCAALASLAVGSVAWRSPVL